MKDFAPVSLIFLSQVSPQHRGVPSIDLAFSTDGTWMSWVRTEKERFDILLHGPWNVE